MSGVSPHQRLLLSALVDIGPTSFVILSAKFKDNLSMVTAPLIPNFNDFSRTCEE